MKKWQEKAIAGITENFDYAKVHKAMKALNWWWVKSDNIPDEMQLKEESIRMLTQCCDDLYANNVPKTFCMTGGFRAEAYKKRKILRLYFILEDWDNE